ncbi:MAG: DUF2235 domain-containing protein [Planctomycetota bacterium]|nr:DUF2235 domain-containing protein [Planctomycetota bacterium]
MGRNIVICCDGTGNQFGRHNTNVVNTYKELVRNDSQHTYYDPGLGTFSPLGRVMGKKVGKALGLAFGWGLQTNIEDAYEYLMDHHQPGDHVYLFGFSRGAYTVRSLAGMICKLGVMQRGSKNLIPYASLLYNARGNDDIAADFKRTCSHDCNMHCIGVWDTVGSLGHLYSRHRFFDVTLHPEIRHGYHAVSIDEKRRKFPVILWDESRKTNAQVIYQVWFPGVHSDVGGSYPESGLSDGSLKWMLNRCEAAGLKLKTGWRDRIQPNPEDKASQHESRTGFWKVWPKATRRIPEGSRIHDSVIRRTEAGVGYAPANLPKEYTVVSDETPAPENFRARTSDLTITSSVESGSKPR